MNEALMEFRSIFFCEIYRSKLSCSYSLVTLPGPAVIETFETPVLAYITLVAVDTTLLEIPRMLNFFFETTWL